MRALGAELKVQWDRFHVRTETQSFKVPPKTREGACQRTLSGIPIFGPTKTFSNLSTTLLYGTILLQTVNTVLNWEIFT